jgi:death-on-curing protein
MRYLTLSELIYINGRVLDNDQIATGKQKVRDLSLLEAAALRPAASAFGEDAYPSLREKTAALFHSIARNHPFTDGNKRTATVAALMMLRVNGQRAAWDMEEALDKILQLAENRLELDVLAAWLPLIDDVPMTQPDATADRALIDSIITEQKWLLDELQQR